MVADDFSGVLVRTNSAVRPQTPEFTGHGVGRLGDKRLMDIQRQVRHIVHKSDGEHLPGILVLLLHIVIDSLDLGGCHVPTGKAVATAIDNGSAFHPFQSRAGIQVYGASDGPGLLGAIHCGDLFYCFRERVQEILRVEGAEQVDLQ